MANPNIAALTSVLGETYAAALTGTAAVAIATNASSSGQVIRVNSLLVANIDGTNDAAISVYINTATTNIAKSVDVPAKATLVVVSKETAVYLNEGQTLYAQASAADDLSVICSFDRIS